MRLFRHFTDLPPDAKGSAVAVGNFDGVHLGHRAVIEEARQIALVRHIPSAVLTFEPHPRSYFRRDIPPYRLTSLRLKAHFIEELGVDRLFVLHFDENLAALPAEEFVRRVIVRGLGARVVVVGFNFVFGKKRSGDHALLQRLSATNDYDVHLVSAVAGPGGEYYSSTRIRDHLAAGEVEAAQQLLGRRWEIEGRVDRGQMLGRSLGFPTANILLGEQFHPRFGVYTVRAGVDHGMETRWYEGIANFGRRPTVGAPAPLLEVHLFDFADDLYGRHLRVQFVGFIRPERKFDGLDALKTQIAADCAAARARHAADNAAQRVGA